jgi:GntR family transcriptional regulator
MATRAPVALPTSQRKSPTVSIDRSSFVPYYLQISQQVRELIVSGSLKAGQPFWSEGAFARKVGVSKMTVRQAFQSLRAEGLLVVEKGKQPVVGSGQIVKHFNELCGFTEEMRRRGLVPSTRLLSITTQIPTPEIAEALRLTKHEKVYEIKRLRFANKDVVGLETVHLPAQAFPHLENHDLERHSLYQTLEGSYGLKLDWSQEVFAAVAAPDEEAKLLRVKPGFPLFCMRRTVYSNDQKPVEHSLSLFRSDRYLAAGKSRRSRHRSG